MSLRVSVPSRLADAIRDEAASIGVRPETVVRAAVRWWLDECDEHDQVISVERQIGHELREVGGDGVVDQSWVIAKLFAFRDSLTPEALDRIHADDGDEGYHG